VINLRHVWLRQRRRRHSASAERITDVQPGMCKFLASRAEVEQCTQFLRRQGYVSHSLPCKDWDMAHIVPHIGDGDVLDMGSSDSYLLKNLSLERRSGQLWGIDLREPDVPVVGARYQVGDLMDTGLPSAAFDFVACLSVIEHGVDFERFTQEASRLMRAGGRLYVTFDYWEPRVTPTIRLYDLDWQPLDSEALQEFIRAAAAAGLELIEPMNWSLGEAVIRDGYYSPEPRISYTFGMCVLEKRGT
jgi:SAM-dependent methyltransferase